jgi:hypothetical protein
VDGSDRCDRQFSGLVRENSSGSEPSLLIEPHLRTILVVADEGSFPKELAFTTLEAAPLPLESGSASSVHEE